MMKVHWQRDTAVRSDFFAHRLDDEDGKVLVYIVDSANTFRKAGDYAARIFAGLTLHCEGQWPEIRLVLVRLFPEHDLADLELPARSFPQTVCSREEYIANR